MRGRAPAKTPQLLYAPDAGDAPRCRRSACRPDMPGAVPLLHLGLLARGARGHCWNRARPGGRAGRACHWFSAGRRQRRDGGTWTAHTTTRKPLLLLRLFGLFLLRTAAAALSFVLFHEPPRKTRPGCLTRCRQRAAVEYHRPLDAHTPEFRACGGIAPTPPPACASHAGDQRTEIRAPEARATKQGRRTPPPENRC
jgi:hypothetical protein